MPWRKEDGNNSKVEGELSPTSSSKKQKTKDHGKNGTARVSFDGVSINTAKTATQSSEESIGSNLDDDDTVDGRRKCFTFDLRGLRRDGASVV
jgi:hypothetical protein